MKTNRINKIIKVLLPMVTVAFMVSCTDIESIEISQPTLEEQNPEQYAKYLENLNAYKDTEKHKVVYAWFDNSNKQPFSRAQHISDVPDSLDVVSLMYPDELAEFELVDMDAVRRKGTKVVYTISFDQIQKDYINKVKEGAEVGTFDVYLKTEVDRLLSCEVFFDGIIAEYKGENPIYMSAEEKADAKAKQDLFFGAIMGWKQANAGKFLTFQGYPENLIGQNVLTDCRHIILVTDNVDVVEKLSIVARKAMISAATPTDRFIVAVSTVSTDSSDKSGWFGEKRAIKEAAYWTTEPSADYARAGIAIYNIQRDYYNSSSIYPCVKEAINIMNPSPHK